VPIECNVPPSRNQPIGFGGVYADHAFVLRGGGICGGALDFPAFGIAGSGPGFAVSVVGPFVDFGVFCKWQSWPGRASVAPQFRLARPPRLLTQMFDASRLLTYPLNTPHLTLPT
jgi:hypothetical protein